MAGGDAAEEVKVFVEKHLVPCLLKMEEMIFNNGSGFTVGNQVKAPVTICQVLFLISFAYFYKTDHVGRFGRFQFRRHGIVNKFLLIIKTCYQFISEIFC